MTLDADELALDNLSESQLKELQLELSLEYVINRYLEFNLCNFLINILWTRVFSDVEDDPESSMASLGATSEDEQAPEKGISDSLGEIEQLDSHEISKAVSSLSEQDTLDQEPFQEEVLNTPDDLKTPEELKSFETFPGIGV